MAQKVLELMKRKPAFLVWGIAALTLGICFVITFDLIPALRGPISGGSEWQWRHVSPPDLAAWKLVLPLGVVAIIGLWAYRTRVAPVSNMRLLMLLGLALAFRLAVQETNVNGVSVVARMLNPAYFGYFPPATAIDDMPQFLRDFADIQPSLPYYRLTTHPPGNTVFYWLIIKVVEAAPALTRLAEPFLTPRMAAWPESLQGYSVPDVVAAGISSLLVPFLSALSIFPLYYLAGQLFGARVARITVLLFVFVPALTLFMPVSDDLYTLLAALAFWLTASGLTQGSNRRLWLAGVVVGTGLFQSLSIIPLAVAAGLFITIYYVAQWRTRWRAGLVSLLIFSVGVVTLWAVLWLAFGLNPIKVFINCLTNYDARGRSYWLSVIYNPYDVLLFVGIPVAVHFICALLRLGQRLVARRPLTLPDYLLLAFAFSMLLLDVGGSLRGGNCSRLF
ncbi:MAG: glycosyltransferase family 39 protein [Chloroflexi bacterium]|nr:glycosyltransferase family 39 protein [Chloroflexota bacterium]